MIKKKKNSSILSAAIVTGALRVNKYAETSDLKRGHGHWLLMFV